MSFRRPQCLVSVTFVLSALGCAPVEKRPARESWATAAPSEPVVRASTALRPVKVLEVPNYCEGIVFDREGNGYVSEGTRIVQFDSSGHSRTWAETGGPNGHKVLADGTHLACEVSRRAVLHVAADGTVLGAASDQCDGTPLRGPNDLTLDAPNGGFYFTDPEGSDLEKPIGTVHYVDRERKTHLLDKELAYPNGIVLSPDGKKLYIAESLKNRVLVYDVVAPGQLGQRRVLAELPVKDSSRGQIDNQPDGICLDEAGNLYVAHYGMREVQVLSPEGKLLARLPAGNLTASNVAFGGHERSHLFVSGGLEGWPGKGGVFRLDIGVRGATILPPVAEGKE
jgi:gluconolactonase